MIYERKVHRNPGPQSYGLICAEGLGIGGDIISDAKKTLNILRNKQTLVLKKNHDYNSEIIMDICEFPGCCENAEESHHILEQCESDKYKNVSGINMNKKSNLVALCKKHAMKLHIKSFFIKGYKETDKGLKLDYIYKDKKIKKINLVMMIL